MTALTVMSPSFSNHTYKLVELVGETVEAVGGRTGGNGDVCVGIAAMQSKIVRKKYASVKKTRLFVVLLLVQNII